jgi:O-antigen ligase
MSRLLQFFNKKSITFWIYSVVGLFLLLNSMFVIYEQFWFPLIVGVLFSLVFTFFAADKLLYLVVFLTPLSVISTNKDFNMGLALPTEPLMVLLTAVFLFRLIYENNYNFKITRHPITITIFIYLLWLFFTSLTSEIPLVSIKFLISKIWYIVPFYFMVAMVFERGFASIRNFFLLYSIGLAIVVIYTTIVHSQYNFSEETGHWVMSPFYNDHTAYGAAIAFFLPPMVGIIFESSYSRTKKLFAVIIFSILFVGFYLSFCRAAWLSIVIAIGVFVLVKLKIKFYWVVSLSMILIGLFFIFQKDIINNLSENKQDSSDNLTEHIQSMSNISTDASNLERINRWSAAMRMFRNRPFIGWGPGTYQFVYAPYQYSYEKTIISTNAGDKGTAHSEYIGPLAETGIIGLLTFIAIAIATFYTAIKVYLNSKSKEVKVYALVAISSLITYYVHGSLNNFLDTDKLAVPFWGAIALIVALDVFYVNTKQENNKTKLS